MKKIILILLFLSLHTYFLKIFNDDTKFVNMFYKNINYINMNLNINNKSKKNYIYVTKYFQYDKGWDQEHFNPDKLKLLKENIEKLDKDKKYYKKIIITKNNNTYNIKINNLTTYCDKLSSSYLIENYNNLGFTLNLLPKKTVDLKSFLTNKRCNHSIEFEAVDVFKPNDNLFILMNGDLEKFTLE